NVHRGEQSPDVLPAGRLADHLVSLLAGSLMLEPHPLGALVLEHPGAGWCPRVVLTEHDRLGVHHGIGDRQLVDERVAVVDDGPPLHDIYPVAVRYGTENARADCTGFEYQGDVVIAV